MRNTSITGLPVLLGAIGCLCCHAANESSPARAESHSPGVASHSEGEEDGRSVYSDQARALIDLGWNSTTTAAPCIYLAADVDPEWENTARDILSDVMEILGNYGPIHYYGLGTDEAAAAPIIEQWCQRLNDPDCSRERRSHEWAMVSERTSDAFTSLVYMANPPVKAIVMALGSLNSDSKGTLVHEYVHAYQMSLLLDRSSREELFPTWLVEGGAEFFASYYAGTKGWRGFTELMQALMQQVQAQKTTISLKESERYAGRNDAISIWGIAFLVHLSSVDTLYRGFNQEIYAKGWRSAFAENFGLSVEEFYLQFAAFLDWPLQEQMAILPTQALEELITSPPPGS